MIAAVVYVLCALTSLACAIMLLRSARRGGPRLVLWSGICFAALTLENVLLLLDNIVFPEVNLAIARNAVGLVGPALLLFALISEAE
jgi:hypothetical protein